MTMKAKATIMVVAVAMMVIFMTTASANEGRSVRRRRQTLKPCTGPRNVPFRICVQTSDGSWIDARGTDSDVGVRLNGVNCHTPYYDLESPADDFENGDYDCFSLTTYDVGTPVKSIQVKLGVHRDDWKMDSMVLRYNNAQTCLMFRRKYWFTNLNPMTIPGPQDVLCKYYRL